MPIDPATGQQLPYAGEPGAAPGAPPMAPGPGPAPGGAGPDDLMAQQDQNAQAQMEMIAGSAPNPSKPFTVKVIQTMIDQFNSTLDALGGGDLPDIEWTPDPALAEGGKWNQPLPPQIFVPVVALNEALKVVGEEPGQFGEKYGFVPEELLTDGDLRKATAQMKRMAGDKKLVEAMQAPAAGAAEPGGEEEALPPGPGAMSPEDRELAGAMA
mgnify:CR=1 FL=1